MHLDPALQPVLLRLAQLERRMAHTGTAAVLTDEEKHLRDLEKQLEHLRSESAGATMAVGDMQLRLARMEDDLRKLQQRLDDDNAQLSAAVDPEVRRDLRRDAEATTTRLDRQRKALEEARAAQEHLAENANVHGAQADELVRQIEVARRAAQAANEVQSRADAEPLEEAAALRAQLPAAVVAEYEEQREVDGSGVALFNGRSCGACFITLPAADRAHLAAAPADELPQCPECGAYLVRKAV